MDALRGGNGLDRRGFLGSVAAAGMGIAMGPMVVEADESEKKPDDINIGIIGCGSQGMLLAQMLVRTQDKQQFGGIQIPAVCDIWEAYALKRQTRVLKAYKYESTGYVDYREMLEKHKELDAVIVATPDVWHEEQAIAALEAGLHVYCETPMAMTAEGARRMIRAARKAGKLLQVGYDRRSDSRYRYCFEKIVRGERLLGRIGVVNGQWNRYQLWNRPIGWPEKGEICGATLCEFGYDSMEQFRNWRQSRKHSAGPAAGLIASQLDVYNWFLGARPSGVLASGGRDFLTAEQSGWYDNLMAVLDYQTAEGTARAYYQMIPMNNGGTQFESFLGEFGTLITDHGSTWKFQVHRQPYPNTRDQWQEAVKKGILRRQGPDDDAARDTSWPLFIDETPPPYKTQPYMLGSQLEDKPIITYQAHMQNFLRAIRGQEELNCPGETGLEALVTALKVDEALAGDGKIEVNAKDYEV